MIESIGGLTREDLMCYVETLDHFGHRISGIFTHITDAPWNQGPWGIYDYEPYSVEYRTGSQMYISLMTDKIRTHPVHSGTKVELTVVGRRTE